MHHQRSIFETRKNVAKIHFEFEKSNNDDGTKILLTMFVLWFEMRATESEKRKIWKKIQDAKKNGKTIDVSDFGESDGLSWKNMVLEKNDV